MNHAAIYVSAVGGLFFLAGVGVLVLHRPATAPRESTVYRTGVLLSGAGLVTLLVGVVMIFAWIFGG